jgi:hypothetical protein
LGPIISLPQAGQQQQLDSLGGQIDAMVPTLAALAAVPETDFQGSANSIDIKAHNEKLLQACEDIAAISNTIESLKTGQVLKTWYTEIDATTAGSFTGGTIYVYRIGRKVTLHFSGLTHASASAPTTNGTWLPTWAYANATVQQAHLIDSNAIRDYSMGATGSGQFEYRTYAGATHNATSTGNVVMTYVSADTDETQSLAEQLGL